MNKSALCLRLLVLVIFLSADCLLVMAGDVRRAFVEDAIQARLVLVPAGTFEMGSKFSETVTNEAERKFFEDESPPHQVTISRDFWVAETEVTVAQFHRFVSETCVFTDAETAGTSLGEYSVTPGAGGVPQGQWITGKGLNWRNPGYMPEDSMPVTHVSWNDARAFCRWLADKTGRQYRLLTEAEWEYAAGGPERSLYSWGDEQPNGKKGGNVADGSFSLKFPEWKYPVLKTYNDHYVFAAPVRSFSANRFGLFDMTGNVWEWVEDLYSPTYYQSSPTNDPTGATLGSETSGATGLVATRVHRGGGFDWELPYLRVMKRRAAIPNTTSVNIGFRIALDEPLSPVPTK